MTNEQLKIIRNRCERISEEYVVELVKVMDESPHDFHSISQFSSLSLLFRNLRDIAAELITKEENDPTSTPSHEQLSDSQADSTQQIG